MQRSSGLAFGSTNVLVASSCSSQCPRRWANSCENDPRLHYWLNVYRHLDYTKVMEDKTILGKGERKLKKKTYDKWRCRWRFIKLNIPLPEHMMDSLLQDSNVSSTTLLPCILKISEYPFKVINTILCSFLQKLMRSRLTFTLQTLRHPFVSFLPPKLF